MTMSWHNQHTEKPPCIECRKRRLRCERPLPCQSCTKLGLQAACLQGSIVKGTRSLKPSSIQLHEDLARMSLRELELEKAINDIQAIVSTKPHPLLQRDSQIRTSSPVPGLQRASDADSKDDPSQTSDPNADGLVAALGALSIRNDGHQYHGDTATSEYLVKESDDTDGSEPPNDLPAKRRPPPLKLPPEIVLSSVLFPWPPQGQLPLPDMNVFLDHLPSHTRAQELVNNYFSYYSWCSMLATQSEVIQNIFTPLYPDGTKTTTLRHSDAHRLAFLFMVFLLGTLYDLDLDIEHVSAQTDEYHSLARAAMAAVPITDHPTVQAVQAIVSVGGNATRDDPEHLQVLMIWYFRLFPGRADPGYQWALSGVLAKTVQAVGIHRNVSSAVPDPADRVLYEQTFWEYYSVDVWHSFMFGRPTSMVSSMIDCIRPSRVDVPTGHDPNFFPWKYSFTQTVSNICVHTTGQPAYSSILKWDKKLRAHPTPESLAWPPLNEPLPSEAFQKTFQRYLMAVWKNVSIMYIHRKWMIDTIMRHRDDPLKSPWWESVVAAYESASALVLDMQRIWSAYPLFIGRMAPFWSHTLSATMVLCALVTYLPVCPFTEEALQHVDNACRMFVDAKESLQPSNALPSLRKYQRKAHDAFDQFRNPFDGKEDDPDMAFSPCESQFPFYGDSPPQMPSAATYSMYSSGLAGGFMASSTGSNDTLASYVAAADQSARDVSSSPVSPRSHGSFGGVSEYGVEHWDRMVSQIGMR